MRCSDDGQLLGAYMSDNGYVILTMFFDGTSHSIRAEACAIVHGRSHCTVRVCRGIHTHLCCMLACADGEGGAVNEATALAAPNGKPTPGTCGLAAYVCRLPDDRTHAMQTCSHIWDVPGRVLKSTTGLTFQDEFEFQDMCESRKNAGSLPHLPFRSPPPQPICSMVLSQVSSPLLAVAATSTTTTMPLEFRAAMPGSICH